MLGRLIHRCFNRRALVLAKQIETRVHSLNGRPGLPDESRGLIESLGSILTLVDSLPPRQVPTDANQSPVGASSHDLVAAPAAEDSPPTLPTKPSATAWDLMRLCDLLWIARSSGAALEAKAVADIFEELNKVLSGEGVIVIRDTGLLDPNRQRVAGTQRTNDPQQRNYICQTVRPGYRFCEYILRPQDVIISTYVSEGGDALCS